MNKKEWDYERGKIRPETFGSASPKGAKSLAISRIDRLEELAFGVNDNAKSKLKQAQNLEITLTPDEVNNYLEEIQANITHKRVVKKALSEGKPVSEDVLKDYPDLQKKYAPTTKESSTVEPKPQETAVEVPTEAKLKAKVKKDTKGFASELKGAVKNGKISEDEAKNILYNLDEETKQQIVDEIGCHCHE